MVDDTYIPEGVNPHQEKEWEMMQAETKPMALFALHNETIPQEFLKPHDFIEKTLEITAHKVRRRTTKPMIFKIFARQEHQDKIETLITLLQQCYQSDQGGITPQREDEIGKLLGYHEAQRAIYRKWVAQFKDSVYLPPQQLHWRENKRDSIK